MMAKHIGNPGLCFLGHVGPYETLGFHDSSTPFRA
jgi:hypothetical protein